ncbi:hypothetical protein [Nodosilinea nodulosa]|uniref:hypothetical protein n=1 Tax=Nodosilinea nodulosa TaxID=416001 RepID=UPI0005930576|nr:hypothetical protein [Nodosilinea nodulosa]
MDPLVTIHDLLEAMARNDREAVDEHLDAIKEWNQKQGFLPAFPKDHRINAFLVTRTLAP